MMMEKEKKSSLKALKQHQHQHHLQPLISASTTVILVLQTILLCKDSFHPLKSLPLLSRPRRHRHRLRRRRRRRRRRCHPVQGQEWDREDRQRRKQDPRKRFLSRSIRRQEFVTQSTQQDRLHCKKEMQMYRESIGTFHATTKDPVTLPLAAPVSPTTTCVNLFVAALRNVSFDGVDADAREDARRIVVLVMQATENVIRFYARDVEQQKLQTLWMPIFEVVKT